MGYRNGEKCWWKQFVEHLFGKEHLGNGSVPRISSCPMTSPPRPIAMAPAWLASCHAWPPTRGTTAPPPVRRMSSGWISAGMRRPWQNLGGWCCSFGWDGDFLLLASLPRHFTICECAPWRRSPKEALIWGGKRRRERRVRAGDSGSSSGG